MKFNMINSVSSESQQQQIVCNSEENGNNNQKFFVNNNTASVNRNYFLNSHQTKTTYSSGLALQKSINLYNLFANNDGRDSSKEFNAVYSAAESITVQKDFLNESVKTKSIIISNTSNINSANELKLSGNDSFSEDNLVSEDNLAEIYSCNVKSGFEISGGEKRSFENSFPPDHRARRPMNAFLIFCKRHRAIVKDKHPNLENRSITKILGDWWTTLENEQKSSYISLAKQYKDAFFTAHPDFKWYKLPAPPVRFQGKSVQAEPTLSFGLESLDDIDSARKDVHIKFEERANRNKGANYPQGVFITSDSKFIYDELNVKKSKKEDSQIGFFKLADTAHMGGLKSLMSDSYNKTIDQTDIHAIYRKGTNNKSSTIEHESSTFKHTSMDSSTNLKNHCYSKHSNNAGLDKSAYNNNPFKRECDSLKYEFHDSHYSRMTVRTCKGKRYQQFMSSAKPGFSSKRSLKSTTSVRKNPQNSEPTPSIQAKIFESEVCDSTGAIIDLGTKFFNASQFDLDKKIYELPCLNLEEYLAKKKDSKSKKKQGKFKSPIMPRLMIVEHTEKIVGSQKRKARKQNIARFNVSIMNNLIPEPDALFTLATLAEIAANENRIDENTV